MLMKSDPSDFMASLSPAQQGTLERYNSQINDLIHERLRTPDSKQSPVEREVTPLMKLRLVDTLYSRVDMSEAILTIWRPHEGLNELLSEGKRFKIYGLAPGT